MKSWILTVEKGGRITLPKELMEYMGWKVGDTLLIQATDVGTILLQRVVKKTLNRRQLPLSDVGTDK